eukprot:COSAG06_NODE_841_length_11989_cov_4.537763_9_plen_72_part_00
MAVRLTDEKRETERGGETVLDPACQQGGSSSLYRHRRGLLLNPVQKIVHICCLVVVVVVTTLCAWERRPSM